MKKEDILKVIKNIWIFIVSLVSELAILLGDLGDIIMRISPLLAAISQLFLTMILGLYAFKIFIYDVKIPIVGELIKKIMKSMGTKNQGLTTIAICDEGTKAIEEKMKQSKTLLLWLFVKLKNTKGVFIGMRKFFVGILKWFYHNKITLGGFLGLIVLVALGLAKYFKPEILLKLGMSNEALVGIMGSLFSLSMASIFGIGLENQEAWDKRHADSNARKQVEKELREKAKLELQKNQWVINVAKEVEAKLVKSLVERVKLQAIEGIKSNYVSLTRLFPELNYQLLQAEINDEPTFNKLIEKINEIAKANHLLENREVVETINGIQKKVVKEVNLLIEEMLK